MKKNFIAAVLMICIAGSVAAQQIPLYSQLYFMRMLYNPALTAYNGSSNIYAFDREQWLSMPGHPSTRGGMAEISLWKDQSGVGVHVVNDVTDIINRINAQVYYAQKIRLAKDHRLSLGVSLGLMNTRIDFTNVIANDASDPNLMSSAKSGIAFDMSVGLAYQWKKLTVSFSVPSVANSNVTLTSQLKNTQFNTKRHYVGGVSYEISIKKETWNIEPSVLIKSGGGNPAVQVDGNIVANYKRMLFLGVGYRMDYGITAMAAVRISRCVTLGYAYEYPLVSHVNFANLGNTHEVIVGLNLDKWLKNDELKKQTRRIDTLTARMDVVKKRQDTDSTRIDSLKAQADQTDKDVKDVKQRIDTSDQNQKVMQTRMDSFENEVKEYRKQVDKKPVKNFSDAMKKDKAKPADKEAPAKDNGEKPKGTSGTTGKTKVKWNSDTQAPGDQPMAPSMENVSQGDIIKMDQVNFEKNSSYLTSDSYKQLDALVQLLSQNPGVHIKVMGHTDFTASDEYNQWLSDRRALRVADYLISKGVPAANVTHIGFGKRNPVADNNTDEGRAKNRRVEIQITKK